MSDLYGNHIVCFPTRRLNFIAIMRTGAARDSHAILNVPYSSPDGAIRFETASSHRILSIFVPIVS